MANNYYDIPDSLYNDLNLPKTTGTVQTASPTVTTKPTGINYGGYDTGGNIFQKIGSTVMKGIDVLNAPSQWTEKKLSPILFGKGVTNYSTGLQKWGVTPEVAQMGQFAGEMVLDPLNLLAVPVVAKGIGKVAKTIVKPVGKVLGTGSDLLKATNIGRKVGDMFALTERAPKVLPKTVELAEDFMKMKPKNLDDYRTAIKQGLNVRMKLSNSTASIPQTITRLTGRSLYDMDVNELSDLYEQIKTGLGVGTRTLEVPVGAAATTETVARTGQQLFPDMVKTIAGTTKLKQVKIPSYMQAGLRDMLNAATVSGDVGIVEKFLRPFYQTIKKYDKNGVLQKVYDTLYAADTRYERATRVMDEFRAKTFGKLALPERQLITEILGKATTPIEIERIGKRLGATPDVIKASIATRQRFESLIDAANFIRQKRGLPEIPKIKNYVTNLVNTQLLDALSDPEIKKAIEAGQDIRYHIDRELLPLINEGFIPPSVKSGFLKKRMLGNASDLGILKTTDIDEILNVYSKSIGKDIHMGLAIDEAKPLVKLLPAQLQKLTNDMMSYGMMRRWTPTDISISNTLGKNFRNISSAYTSAGYTGGLGFNMRSPLQNYSQQVLTYTETGIKDWVKAHLHLAKPTSFDMDMMKKSKIMNDRITESGFTGQSLRAVVEEMQRPTMAGNKLQKVKQVSDKLGMAFFNMSEQTNVGQAFLAGAYKKIDQMGGLEKVLKSDSLIEKAIAEGDKVAKITQFSYRRMDMPPAMWSALGRMLFQYQTYPINLIFYLSNLRGADKWGRFFAGSNAVNKVFQQFLGYSPFDLANLATRGTDYGGYALAGSPFVQQVNAAINAAAMSLSPTASEDQKNQALMQLVNKLKIMVPYGLGIERVIKTAAGQTTIPSIFGQTEKAGVVQNAPFLQPKVKRTTVQPTLHPVRITPSL